MSFSTLYRWSDNVTILFVTRLVSVKSLIYVFIATRTASTLIGWTNFVQHQMMLVAFSIVRFLRRKDDAKHFSCEQSYNSSVLTFHSNKIGKNKKYNVRSCTQRLRNASLRVSNLRNYFYRNFPFKKNIQFLNFRKRRFNIHNTGYDRVPLTMVIGTQLWGVWGERPPVIKVSWQSHTWKKYE